METRRFIRSLCCIHVRSLPDRLPKREHLAFLTAMTFFADMMQGLQSRIDQWCRELFGVPKLLKTQSLAKKVVSILSDLQDDGMALSKLEISYGKATLAQLRFVRPLQ